MSIVERSDVVFRDAKTMEFTEAAHLIHIFEAASENPLDESSFESDFLDPCITYVFGYLDNSVVGYIKLYYTIRLSNAWLTTLVGNDFAMPDPLSPMAAFAVRVARSFGAKWLYTSKISNPIDSCLYELGFQTDSQGDLRFRLR